MFYQIDPNQLIWLIAIAIPVHAIWILFSRRLHPLYLLAVVSIVLMPFSVATDSAPIIVALKYARAYTALLAAVVGVAMLLTRHIRLGKASVTMLVFTLFLWLSALWGEDPLPRMIDRMRLVIMIVGGVCMGITIASQREFRSSVRLLFVAAMGWAALLVVGISLGQFHEGRLAIFGMNANGVAMVCGFCFLVSLAIAIYDARVIWRLTAYATAGVILVGALLTGSRGGVGAMAVGTIPLIAPLARRPMALAGFLFMAAVVAYVASGYLLDESAVERLVSTQNTREGVWRYCFEQVNQSPWLGQGSVYEYSRLTGQRTDFNTHSMYLHALVNAGAIGLGLLGLAMAVLLSRYLKAWRSLQALSRGNRWPVYFGSSILIATLAYGIFEAAPVTGVSIYSMVLGIAAGMADWFVSPRWLNENQAGYAAMSLHTDSTGMLSADAY